MRKCIICGKETELGIMDEDKNIKCISCAVLDGRHGTAEQKKNQLKAEIQICKQNISHYNNSLKRPDVSELIKVRIEKALKNENWKLSILEFVCGGVNI